MTDPFPSDGSTAPLADRGPCTECRTPHDACVGPDYCCDECLHLDEGWDGYRDEDDAPSPGTRSPRQYIPFDDEHMPVRYRLTGESFCRLDGEGWPCRRARGLTAGATA